MILQLLRQLNNPKRSKTITCSASFCFGLSLMFPCPLPKRISSRILSKSMFIPQNHPKSRISGPVFRASLTMSMLEIELYQISLPYDRGRSGYEIRPNQGLPSMTMETLGTRLKDELGYQSGKAKREKQR